MDLEAAVRKHGEMLYRRKTARIPYCPHYLLKRRR